MKLRKGFTLIELLIVVLILGALAAIAIPRISESADTAKANACATNIDVINAQVEIWAAKKGSYPANLAALAADGNYLPDGVPECPYGSSYSYSLDATTHRASCNHP
ncbi:MAG: prepilin-type N-terminal cleavage/methylation domain-containing protein [Sedimentisphaerales bacterium]|nr:prepilin-type N-terminal cleavage/methylation domain-containing protein [Sedimentisphaerales bacterium]